MKLFAISDLHLNYRINRDALVDLPAYPEDWLIVAGDIGESESHFHFAFSVLTQRFARLIWVPGNHDLWSHPSDPHALAGDTKYRSLVSLCRKYGVITPEDPYVCWSTSGKSWMLVPLFLLYDYSFRPANISLESAVAWARSNGILCRDEIYLKATPYASLPEWCHVRYEYTRRRLNIIPEEMPLVLINHYPLLASPLKRLLRIPQFSIWCGTSLTCDWHRKYPVVTVVYGHLHIRATDYYDGIRFEEVSLGYPKHWSQPRGMQAYLRQILPPPL